MLVGVALAFSPVGARLSALPLGLFVGLQAFRLPLEMILHGLHGSGDLPVQMPFNWIVGVHVWTALVGHLIIGRALLARRRSALAPVAHA